MEDKIKTALANIDKIISTVNMSRKEHAILAQDIQFLTNTCKDHLQLLKKEKEDKKDE